MQKNNMSFLKNLTTVADARTARASSWDQSGRNKDYWLVNAGDTAVYSASGFKWLCCTGN